MPEAPGSRLVIPRTLAYLLNLSFQSLNETLRMIMKETTSAYLGCQDLNHPMVQEMRQISENLTYLGRDFKNFIQIAV